MTDIKVLSATDAVSLINKVMTKGPFWKYVLESNQPKIDELEQSAPTHFGVLGYDHVNEVVNRSLWI